MQLLEAKNFIGRLCSITWRERSGEERQTISKVHDATYVPLYGGYLITDIDDIRLDRIIQVLMIEDPAFAQGDTITNPAAASAASHSATEKLAA